MTATKFVIPLEVDDDESAKIVKCHFRPGEILEGIRREKQGTRESEKNQSAKSSGKEAPKEVSQDGRKQDVPYQVSDRETQAAGVTGAQGPGTSGSGSSGSSFEAAFGHLKESKFYEEPPAPKAEDSSKKPESYPLKTSCVLVSSRQKGNPLLKSIHNVPWEFSEIEPDYIMGKTTCALFLSLRYFNLYPNYIHDRLKSLGKAFQLRILLVQVDVADPYPPLRDLSRIAIYTDCTLVLAWSSEEAGKYIETYKILENKSADTLMERQDDDSYSKIVDSLTKVKSVNQTNATTLLTTYGSLDKVLKAQPDELALLPGIGPLKAKKLHSVIHQPFLKLK